MLSGMEPMNCTGLAVPMEVMQHIVRVESSHNRFAIGVVGGHLVRQPKSLQEALATVRMLESRGYNFSLGIAQVNRYNLARLGLDSYEKAFELCPNLQAGSRILADCHGRSGGDWGKSFSCYYSGNFVTGYKHGYVKKIYASMRDAASQKTSDAPNHAISMVNTPSRRVTGVTLHAATVSPIQGAAPSQEPRASVDRFISAEPADVTLAEGAGHIFQPEFPLIATDAYGSARRILEVTPPASGLHENGQRSESAVDENTDSAFVF